MYNTNTTHQNNVSTETSGSKYGHVRMRSRMESFLDLSASLTGFKRVHLMGTGMVQEYLSKLDEILPVGFVDEMLAVYGKLPSGEYFGSTLSEQILDDPKIGPVARNLIVLWYCGTWRRLPDDWRTTHCDSPLGNTHVVSSEAYVAGLQWAVVGAHPSGAMPQGFASWSNSARGNER